MDVCVCECCFIMFGAQLIIIPLHRFYPAHAKVTRNGLPRKELFVFVVFFYPYIKGRLSQWHTFNTKRGGGGGGGEENNNNLLSMDKMGKAGSECHGKI